MFRFWSSGLNFSHNLCLKTIFLRPYWVDIAFTTWRYVHDVRIFIIFPFIFWLSEDFKEYNAMFDDVNTILMDCLRACPTLPWSRRFSSLSLKEHVFHRLNGLRCKRSHSQPNRRIFWEIEQNEICNLSDSFLNWKQLILSRLRDITFIIFMLYVVASS